MSAKKKPSKKAAKKAAAKKAVVKKTASKRTPASGSSAGTARLEPLGSGWSFTPLAPAGSADATRRAGPIHAIPHPLPDFLPTDDFETLQEGELHQAPGRRGPGEAAGTSSSLQLAAEVPEDAAVFLTVRQESGAISFHLPAKALRRRGGSTGSRVVFDVPLSSATPETGRRGVISKIVRVVLVKVAKKVVSTLTEMGSGVIVPFLATQLEQFLWRNRTLGWVRVSRELLSGTADAMKPGRPAIPAGQRGLLLIHGTFSSCHGGFRDLAAGSFFDATRELYGNNIYGFNHFTFSATPEENVKELLDSLPPGPFEFDIITHSRGGLVARELLEGSGLGHPRRGDLKIGRVIMVASPSLGTPLASPSHWDAKLSFWANLIELLPDNPFSTGAAWLAEALKWLASDVLANCEGLAAMDPGGDFITAIKEPPDAPPGTEYHAVVSNFHPPREWLARLGDMAVDSFFGEANDLVVPSEGAWKTSDAQAAWVPGSRIACFGAGGNITADKLVHHCNYFKQEETWNYIAAVLGGKPSPFAALDATADLPSRSLRRGAAPRLAAPAAVPAAAALAAPAPAPLAPLQGSLAAIPEDADTWNKEEYLFLTVVSGEEEKEIDHEGGRSPVPVLLASYGSARVAVPFRIRGSADNAGTRWHKIIGMQRFLVGYANGQAASYVLPAPDGRKFETPTEDFLRVFGDELFRTLFPGEVRILYNIARFQHARRRLNIIFTSMIPWVADLPWEIAFDQSCDTFLSCADVRFIRNTLTPIPANRIEPDLDKLRILVVAAQPADLGSLSVDDERQAIYESFRPLIDSQLADVEVMTGVTAELLHIKLRTPGAPEYDVLHFIGHGEFDMQDNTGYLIFESSDRRAQKVSSASFLNIVRSRNIRVVFLNACETGRGDGSSYNRGVAMALARDGIPAVVANQYSVIDRSASLFSLHFYACLAHGLNLGDAMREARIAIQYKGVEPMDWGVPVLFASQPDAKLCRPNSKVYPNAFLQPALPPPTPVSIELAPAAAPPPGLPSSGSTRARPRAARATQAAAQQTTVTVPRKVISVWDAENSLAYRENLEGTLDELNAAQDSFAFRFERFSSPRDLWTRSDKKTTGSVAYLRAENIIKGLTRIRESIGSDYLFCVTGLPLRDDETTALYYYPASSVSVFSTWALEPPLEGILLKRAIANYAAISLLYEISPGSHGGSSSADRAHPIHTVGYYNGERSVEHIAGRMKIMPRTMAELRKAAGGTACGEHDLTSIQALLALYHDAE